MPPGAARKACCIPGATRPPSRFPITANAGDPGRLAFPSSAAEFVLSCAGARNDECRRRRLGEPDEASRFIHSAGKYSAKFIGPGAAFFDGCRSVLRRRDARAKAKKEKGSG